MLETCDFNTMEATNHHVPVSDAILREKEVQLGPLLKAYMNYLRGCLDNFKMWFMIRSGVPHREAYSVDKSVLRRRAMNVSTNQHYCLGWRIRDEWIARDQSEPDFFPGRSLGSIYWALIALEQPSKITSDSGNKPIILEVKR